MLWSVGSDLSTVRSDVGSVPPSSSRSLSSDDKRVNRILIREKEEREEAIESLKKLVKKETDDRVESVESMQKAMRREEQERKNVVQEIQRSLEDLATKLEMKDNESSAQDYRTPSPRRIDDREVREVRIAFEERIAHQQRFIDENRRTVQQHAQQLEELYAASATVEPRISSIEQIQRRMGAALAPSPMLSPRPGAVQGDLELRLKKQDEQLTALRSLVDEDRSEVVAAFQARFNKVQKFQTEQAQHLTNLRALVVEVQMSLLLHAVKASRIALRSNELSQEERLFALDSLDAKEHSIKEDVSSIMNKLDISCGVAEYEDLSGLPSMTGASSKATAQDDNDSKPVGDVVVVPI